MSNNQLLILLGSFLLAWGVWEVFEGKARVRKSWGWEFEIVVKEERPIQYWVSVSCKIGIGIFMIVVSAYRYMQGITT